MLGRVHRAGDHAVCMSFINHHGPKVGYVFHQVAGHGQVYVLVFPQFVKGGHIVLKMRRSHRVQNVHCLQVQVQVQSCHLLGDLSRVAQQGEFYRIYIQQLLGSHKDTGVCALGQHNVLFMRLRLF